MKKHKLVGKRKTKKYKWPKASNLAVFYGKGLPDIVRDLQKEVDNFKEEVKMHKFSVGDRVEPGKRLSSFGEFTFGKIYSIIHIGRKGGLGFSSDGRNFSTLWVIDDKGEEGYLWSDDVQLIKEATMSSKYEILKQRIEALDNGWDKDADDIRNGFDLLTSIRIQDDATSGYGYILVSTNREDKTFDFKNQCEKMSAFKSALLWLLDHSDIKKEELAKPGDYVVALDTDYFRMNPEIAKPGAILIAQPRTDDEFVYLLQDRSANCSQRSVRLATPEEIEKYQKRLVGQEIKAEIEGKTYKVKILEAV